MGYIESCRNCRNLDDLDFAFSMAFQPIVDLEAGEIFAHEALVRGLGGEGAGEVLSRVNDQNRYMFDQSCRVKAIELAARLGMNSNLSINFMPNAVYRAEACIQKTLATAERVQFPLDRIIFEITEGERVVDHAHLLSIITEYKRHGFRTAIDDFGAGYAGLNLLADFQPDIIKLDMQLTRGIARDRARQSIVKGILAVCADLEITVVAEGIETADERDYLRDHGIRYFQGYFFARPAFEALPPVAWQPLAAAI